MQSTEIAKALVALTTIAFLVVVVAMPLSSDLATSKGETVSQEPDTIMSEAAEGYSATVSLVSASAAGIPSATFEISVGGSSREAVMRGGDSLSWVMDCGTVTATVAGLTAPWGVADGSVEISGGTVADGTSEAAYTWLIAPSESGDRGLFTKPFKVGQLAEIVAVAGEHVGRGIVSTVTTGDGAFSMDFEVQDGVASVSGGSWSGVGETVPVTGCVAPLAYYDASAGGQDAAGLVISAAPVLILVGALAVLIAAIGRRIRWASREPYRPSSSWLWQPSSGWQP